MLELNRLWRLAVDEQRQILHDDLIQMGHSAGGILFHEHFLLILGVDGHLVVELQYLVPVIQEYPSLFEPLSALLLLKTDLFVFAGLFECLDGDSALVRANANRLYIRETQFQLLFLFLYALLIIAIISGSITCWCQCLVIHCSRFVTYHIIIVHYFLGAVFDFNFSGIQHFLF